MSSRSKQFYSADFVFRANLEDFREIAKNISLRKVVHSLICVIRFYRSTLDSLKSKKKIIKQSRLRVSKLIKRIQPNVPVKSACRMLGITVQSYYRWASEVLSHISVFSLCRKTHPLQLTRNEQNLIHKYAKHFDYQGWSYSSIHSRMVREYCIESNGRICKHQKYS